jgi:hypothetical protein
MSIEELQKAITSTGYLLTGHDPYKDGEAIANSAYVTTRHYLPISEVVARYRYTPPDTQEEFDQRLQQMVEYYRATILLESEALKKFD